LLKIAAHPNVVSIQGVEVLSENEIGIVMELCGGGSLRDILRQTPVLSEFFIWTILMSLAGALANLTKLQIVHRDIKPENILITADYQFKLSDFGLAKVVKSTTGTFTGTLCYMAPEILGNETYGKEVDVWSLGCCLYEMMAGERPFTGKTAPELLASIQKGPSPLPDKYSAGLRQLVKNMLSIDRNARPLFFDLFKRANQQRDVNLARDYQRLLFEATQFENDRQAFARLVVQQEQEFAFKKRQLNQRLQKFEFYQSLAKK
jgi:serine/threonine protein kinase